MLLRKLYIPHRPPKRSQKEWFDFVFKKNHNLLKKMACEARLSEAEHYNGFLVGACLLAFNPRIGRFEIFTGGNRKLIAGEDPLRLCAEDNAVAKAVRAGYTIILAIVIAAPFKLDDLLRKHLEGTLLACKYCRQKIAETWMPNGYLALDTHWSAMCINEVGEIDAEVTTTIRKIAKYPYKLVCAEVV